MSGAGDRRLRGRRLRRRSGDSGQIAQVGAELPEFPIGKRPRGHAGVPDAVLEVIEELPIAHALHLSAAQIRWPRILTAADFRLAAAVVRVANLALLGVELMARVDVCPSGP